MKFILGFIFFLSFTCIKASPFCSTDTILNWQVYLNHKLLGSGNESMVDKPVSSMVQFHRNDILSVYCAADLSYTVAIRYVEIRNKKNRLIRLYAFKNQQVFKEILIPLNDFFDELEKEDKITILYYDSSENKHYPRKELLQIPCKNSESLKNK